MSDKVANLEQCRCATVTGSMRQVRRSVMSIRLLELLDLIRRIHDHEDLFAPRRHRSIVDHRVQHRQTKQTRPLVTRFPMSFSDRSSPREKAKGGVDGAADTTLPRGRVQTRRVFSCWLLRCWTRLIIKSIHPPSLTYSYSPFPPLHLITLTPHTYTRTSSSHYPPAQPFSCWSK